MRIECELLSNKKKKKKLLYAHADEHVKCYQNAQMQQTFGK